ncbi:MAG: hypothetical protein ABWY78_21215 [Microvirga sp.]
MRPNTLILILVAISAVVGIYLMSDPQQGERLSQMYRDAALTGEARDYALFALAIGVGGFIVYLTMTRR